MKPVPIYDNLNSVWRNPITWDKVSTETWLHTHEVKRRCKDILLGVVSVVCMGIMGLSVIIMLFKQPLFPTSHLEGSEQSGPFSFYDFIAYINVITQWFTKLVRLPDAFAKYRVVFIMR